jgi:hypothetical protein
MSFFSELNCDYEMDLSLTCDTPAEYSPTEGKVVYGGPNSGNFRLAVAHEEMNSRRRNTMEDCHRILPIFDKDDKILSKYSYFGIYDGHGGRQIVDFLEEALENTIANELKQPDEASIQERLTRFFLNAIFILFYHLIDLCCLLSFILLNDLEHS